MSFSSEEAVKVLAQKFLMQEGIAGVSHGSPQLTVYVENEEVAKKVPPTILGLPVKTVVSGRFQALSSSYAPVLQVAESVSESRTAMWRPAPGGVSVGYYTITAGTLSTRVYDVATGAKLFLSNNHVLAATNTGEIGGPILQPGPYDGGQYPADELGVLYRFVELKPPPDSNLVDAAVGKPLQESDLADEILDVGVVTDWEDASVGMTVAKSGRSSGYTTGTVSDVNAAIKVYYSESEYFLFEDQIITTAMGEPGDSGSLVVDPSNKKAVGLLFAGSDTLTAVNKIGNVLSALNISFTPTPTQTLPAGVGWSPVALLGFTPLVVVLTVISGNELVKVSGSVR